MASAGEVRAVNLAGLVQGITLVTFPAASSVFTGSSGYGLSGTRYGAMFLPQVITAIITSLLGAGLAGRLGAKRVLLLGLAANLTAMVLLVVSTGFEDDTAVAYPILLVATAFLGTGFGLTVPTLNTYVAAFRPQDPDRAVLVLNALLGLGTATAPVFVAVFVGLGFWWGLPVLSSVLITALLVVCAGMPLEGATAVAGGPPSARPGIPARFWVLAGFAVLYGVCETMNGNWSQQEMTSAFGASTTQAALALTAFWAMVTVGRVLFAALERWLPGPTDFALLPWLLVVTFALTALELGGSPWSGILLFGLAGLGCSALLPLAISLGHESLPAMSTAVAGGVIAAYQVGYGIAAFGVGPLVDAGVDLSRVYGWTALVAVGLGLLAYALTRRPAAVPAGR